MSTLEGVPKEIIEKELGDAYKFGFGNAKSKKIVDLKDGKIIRVSQEFIDEDQVLLQQIRIGNVEIPKK